LRGEIARSRALAAAAVATREALRRDQGERATRRQALTALETRQRLALRDASGVADRESERALALAEQARDLGGLIDRLGDAGKLREQLALLPGPVIRPDRPELAQVTAAPPPSAAPTGAPAGYILPIDGRLIAGFGSTAPGVPASRGIALAPRGGAQAVAPAKGRVAFAGPYRGYGNIVIVEHAGGWTSLITGLAQLSVRVGDDLVAGAPLGSAAPVRPVLTLEVRRDGEAVNPLELVRG
jgi:septal ring factor EnvC (AmiA/AmiB activator)